MAYTGLQGLANKTAANMNQTAAKKTAGALGGATVGGTLTVKPTITSPAIALANIGPQLPANYTPTVNTTPISNVGSTSFNPVASLTLSGSAPNVVSTTYTPPAQKPTFANKAEEVAYYNAPSGSKVNVNVVDALLAKNLDKGDPNFVTGEQLKSAEQKGQIDTSLGNLLSSNAAVAKGAAALGVQRFEAATDMSGKKNVGYKGDFDAAAKALGIDLTPYKKTVTGAMGAKQTVLDKAAAYDAINNAANKNGLYAITEREAGTTGSAKNATHTTTLYTNQGGTLQPLTNAEGNPVTSTFKANTFTSDDGFFGGLVSGITGIASEMSPILIAMGLGNGLSAIMNSINNAGVASSTLDAVNGSVGDLVSKSTSSIATDIAKDLGSTIIREAISQQFGPLAGNVAGFGMNYAGLTGGINKGLVSGLDINSDMSQPYVDSSGVAYDEYGNPSYQAIGPNQSTGFNYIDSSGVLYDEYGNPAKQMAQGSYVDSSGNVYDEIGNPAGNINIGGQSGLDLSGILGGSGEIVPLNDAINKIIASGGVPNYSSYFDGTKLPTNLDNVSPVDWAKVFGNASNYSMAGALAQAAAAKYAADQQTAAAKYAQDLQQKRFETINAQYAPQRGAGYSALNQIRGMLPGQYQQYDEQGKPLGMATGTDYLTRQFTPQDLYAGLAPNYNFMLQQGQQAAQRQVNLGGGGLGGNALRAMQQYTQDYAGNAYQNAFGNFQTQRNNIYNTLAGIAGIGQTAQNTTAQAGQAATNAISQLGVGSAAAQAAGITGAANAVAGGAQNYGSNQILQAILQQQQDIAARSGNTGTPPYNPA